MGFTDHDNNVETPPIKCPFPSSQATYPGHVGPCECLNNGVLDAISGICSCQPGTSGQYCEEHDPAWTSECGAGSTDDDNAADTPCVPCSAGHYVPAGSVGPCANHECGTGTTDDDHDPSTPCVPCSSASLGSANGTSLRGWAGPCPRYELCENGGVASAPAFPLKPRSCNDHWALGERSDGVYEVWPDGGVAGGSGVSVYCDMNTEDESRGGHSNGWMLVASYNGYPPGDVGKASSEGLDALYPTSDPTDGVYGIYNGFRDLVASSGGKTDIRFSCARSSGNIHADLAFFDVDWYLRMSSATDFESNMTHGAVTALGAPARKQLLSGVKHHRCDAYASPFAPEVVAHDERTFLVDLDNGGGGISSFSDAQADWGSIKGTNYCGGSGSSNKLTSYFVRCC